MKQTFSNHGQTMDTKYVESMLETVDRCILCGENNRAASLFLDIVKHDCPAAMRHTLPDNCDLHSFISITAKSLEPFWKGLSTFWKDCLIFEAIDDNDFICAKEMLDCESLIRPWDEDIFVMYAMLHESVGNLRTALAYIEMVESHSAVPSTITIGDASAQLVEKIRILSELGEEQALDRLFLEYECSDNEESAYIYTLKALCMRNAVRYSDGLGAIQKALEIRRDEDALFYCGWFLREFKRFDEAEECFAELEAMPPTDNRDYFLAFVYCYRGNYTEANEIVARLVKKHPCTCWVHFMAAEIASLQGRISEGTECLRNCFALGCGGLLDVLYDPALTPLRQTPGGRAILQQHINQCRQNDAKSMATLKKRKYFHNKEIRFALKDFVDSNKCVTHLPTFTFTIDRIDFTFLLATSYNRTYIADAPFKDIPLLSFDTDHYIILKKVFEHSDTNQYVTIYDKTIQGIENTLCHAMIDKQSLPPINFVQNPDFGHYLGQDFLSRFESVTIYDYGKMCHLSSMPVHQNNSDIDFKWHCGSLYVECGLGNHDTLETTNAYDYDPIFADTLALIDTTAEQSFVSFNLLRDIEDDDIPLNISKVKKTGEDTYQYYVDFDIVKIGLLQLENVTFRVYESEIDMAIGYDLISSFQSFTIDNRNCKLHIVR